MILLKIRYLQRKASDPRHSRCKNAPKKDDISIKTALLTLLLGGFVLNLIVGTTKKLCLRRVHYIGGK
jgi:hypothetical protein